MSNNCRLQKTLETSFSVSMAKFGLMLRACPWPGALQLHKCYRH